MPLTTNDACTLTENKKNQKEKYKNENCRYKR